MSKRSVLTWRAALWIAALLPCFLVAESRGGQITATLSANPSTLAEGGTTTFTLSLQDQPIANGVYDKTVWGGGYTWYDSYYCNGTGSMNSVSGLLDTGDGQTPISVGGSPTGTTYTSTVSATYLQPGDFTATFSGYAGLSDNVGYNNYYQKWYYDYYWQQWYWNWAYGGGSNNAGSETSTTNISASTQIHVSNVAPTITQLSWTPEVFAGQNFSFSATASDPGLAGGETLSFAYDLNGTGQYTNFLQTGGATDSGTYHFDNPGTYTVGVKVTDSNGASTLGHFNVQVDPLPAVPAPEPSSVVLLGLGAVFLGGSYRLRRRKLVVM